MIDEALIERSIDRRVWARLNTDSAYNNAENAEEQSAREEEIERQVTADVYAQYGIEF